MRALLEFPHAAYQQVPNFEAVTGLGFVGPVDNWLAYDNGRVVGSFVERCSGCLAREVECSSSIFQAVRPDYQSGSGLPGDGSRLAAGGHGRATQPWLLMKRNGGG